MKEKKKRSTSVWIEIRVTQRRVQPDGFVQAVPGVGVNDVHESGVRLGKPSAGGGPFSETRVGRIKSF